MLVCFGKICVLTVYYYAFLVRQLDEGWVGGDDDVTTSRQLRLEFGFCESWSTFAFSLDTSEVRGANCTDIA